MLKETEDYKRLLSRKNRDIKKLEELLEQKKKKVSILQQKLDLLKSRKLGENKTSNQPAGELIGVKS